MTTIEGVPDEQVDTVTTRSNVQMTIGRLPDERGLTLFGNGPDSEVARASSTSSSVRQIQCIRTQIQRRDPPAGHHMQIATIGEGVIDGTLGRLWSAAGHDVVETGRGGGDVSRADVVPIAVPSGRRWLGCPGGRGPAPGRPQDQSVT